MDVKDMFKFQMMSQLGSPQGNTVKTSDGNFNIWPMLCQVFLVACMGLFEEFVKLIPTLLNNIKRQFLEHFQTKMEKAIELRPKLIADSSVPLSKKHFMNTFTMMRVYTNTSDTKQSSNTSHDTDTMVDAVLSHISQLSNVPSFQLIENTQIMINYKEMPVQITKDIYVKIMEAAYTDEKLTSIKLCLMSNTISASEIAKYVRGLYNAYLEAMKNALGSNIYFFDQKERSGVSQPPPDPRNVSNSSSSEALSNYKRMRINTAPKQLTFTMTPFHSNKQFSNIFGKDVRKIEQRVKFFNDNRDWYDDKGIPYQLGLLLSGLPGSGKTSVIRAIANMTKRHIINVNFANITTATQLKNLFYSDKIQAFTDSTMTNNHTFCIPMDQRLYVLEEIDAIGNIVKQRTTNDVKTEAINDELNLAEILTVLDGTIEIPGRIVIMTTNHPEVLDKALIRPGRIDVRVNFSYADREQIVEMYEAYLDTPFDIKNIDFLPDKILSAAEVGQVLFRHFGLGHSEEEVLADFKKVSEEMMILRGGKPVVETFTEPVEKTDDYDDEKVPEKKNETVEQLDDFSTKVNNEKQASEDDFQRHLSAASKKTIIRTKSTNKTNEQDDLSGDFCDFPGWHSPFQSQFAGRYDTSLNPLTNSITFD